MYYYSQLSEKDFDLIMQGLDPLEELQREIERKIEVDNDDNS